MIVAMPVHISNEAQLHQHCCNKETPRQEPRRQKSTYLIYESEVDNPTTCCGYPVFKPRCANDELPVRTAILRFIRRRPILAKSLLVG